MARICDTKTLRTSAIEYFISKMMKNNELIQIQNGSGRNEYYDIGYRNLMFSASRANSKRATGWGIVNPSPRVNSSGARLIPQDYVTPQCLSAGVPETLECSSRFSKFTAIFLPEIFINSIPHVELSAPLSAP